MKRSPVRAPMEDRLQVAALARLEAEALGFDPDIAARKAIAALDWKEYRWECWAKGLSEASTSEMESFGMGWAKEARDVVRLSVPSKLDAGQRKTWKRATAILVLQIAGFSGADIGELFGISAITAQHLAARTRIYANLPKWHKKRREAGSPTIEPEPIIAAAEMSASLED